MKEKPFPHANDYCLCERDSRCYQFKDCWPSGKFGIDLVDDQPISDEACGLSPESPGVREQADQRININESPVSTGTEGDNKG